MKATVFLISAVMVLASFSLVAAQSIYLDHVDGLNGEGTIDPGANLSFYIHITGDADNHRTMTNGYRFFSDDVTWDPITATDTDLNWAYPWDWRNADYTCIPPCLFFDLGTPAMACVIVSTGSGADTVGYGGCVGSIGSGLPAGFDDWAYYITLNNVNGPDGAPLTLDSSWYPPAGYWIWDIVEENIDWGGPYTYYMYDDGPPPEPYTDCSPQPTILKVTDNILKVHLYNENTALVDLMSMRVGNIPPYSGTPVIEDGVITTDCFIFRFLGSSGFRPITGSFTNQYTLNYNYTDGTEAPELIGAYALEVLLGDVNLDGNLNLDDAVFFADFMFRDGQRTTADGEELPELMDLNGNDQIDARDLLALVDLLDL